jgi:hypothetical protein
MYTVEKESDHWLILKADIGRIAVKSESLARAIAAMLNAFAEAGRWDSAHLLPPGVAQEKAKGLSDDCRRRNRSDSHRAICSHTR